MFQLEGIEIKYYLYRVYRFVPQRILPEHHVLHAFIWHYGRHR